MFGGDDELPPPAEDVVKIELPVDEEEEEAVPPDFDASGGDAEEEEENRPKRARKEVVTSTTAQESGEEESGEDEEVYEVEQVMQERKRGGLVEYLIRWKGYGAEYDTWEPEDNLNCDEIIERFKAEKQQKAKPKGTPGRKRKAPVEDHEPIIEPKPKGRRGRPPKEKKPEDDESADSGTPAVKKRQAPKRKSAAKKKPASSAEDSDDGEPPTIIRCKTRFKKYLIEYAVTTEDDRDDADDQSENSLKKYFVKYNLDTGIFTVGEHTMEVDEETKRLICGACKYEGPIWGMVGKKTVEQSYWQAKDLAIRMMHHMIGQHLGGFTCRVCAKSGLVFHVRTYRALQIHLNESHRKKLDMTHCDEEEDEGKSKENGKPVGDAPEVPFNIDTSAAVGKKEDDFGDSGMILNELDGMIQTT